MSRALGQQTMPSTGARGEIAQSLQYILGGMLKRSRFQFSRSQQVINAMPCDHLLERAVKPPCPRSVGLGIKAFKNLSPSPADPGVAGSELNDGAAEGTYANHWVIRSSTISNKKEHFPARSALVRGCPGMAEVSPHIKKPNAGQIADIVRRNRLHIRIDARSKSTVAVLTGKRRSIPERPRQFAPVPHKGKDGMPLPFVRSLALQIADEFAHRRRCKLCISLDMVASTHLRLARIGARRDIGRRNHDPFPLDAYLPALRTEIQQYGCTATCLGSEFGS